MNHEEHEVHEAISPQLENLARVIVDAGLKVHRTLGPGLLESAYEACLAHELHTRGISFLRQVALSITYEGVKLDIGYRLDILVENSIIIEIKAVDALSRVHDAQIITYLKLSGCRLGFLMNFNITLFKHGLKRMVL